MFDLDFVVSGEPLLINRMIMLYIIQFINEKIILKYNIIHNSNYTVVLGVMLFLPGNYGPSGVYVFERTDVGNTRIYMVQLPVEKIYASDNPMRSFTEFLLEAIEIFFVKNYKRVKAPYLEKLVAEEFDMGYILSLPYPASPDEVVIYDRSICSQLAQ